MNNKMNKLREKPAEKIWAEFQESHKITDEQLEQFKKYKDLLSEWNKTMNLTAIHDLSGIVRQHFEDSVALAQHIDLKTIKSLADIGTGAGFPAIPLKIIFPHLQIFLLEVNKKKQQFLQALIDHLNLKDIEIVDLDWRTFLRTTQADIDLFVTRAAIDELELSRMFQPGCFYKNSRLIYWVTDVWEPHPRAKQFLRDLKNYSLGKRQRKLAFMGLEK
jgi:16S rRNA (guanine(527)-N(7))-methyltransferase RsmG